MAANRREFLGTALGASSLLAFGRSVPMFLERTARAAEPRRRDRDTILVVVQLAGGNDGLNTIVPFDDPAYANARPTLRLPAAQVHRINDSLGFHPQMQAFHRLFRDGLLTVVQGVGYPNPHGGHEESMRVWQTASLPPSEVDTGWLGRAVDTLAVSNSAGNPAVFVGSIHPPLALNAVQSFIPTLHTLNDCVLSGQRRSQLAALAELPRPGMDHSLNQFVRRSSLAACATSRQVENLGGSARPQGDYPNFVLARQLRTISQLIRADLGIRIFFTELGGEMPGGFDTHAGQALNHGALLEQLSLSVTAFVEDLRRERFLDRVILVTFSEFGRTTQENGRRGTDHGSAQPIFLVGGKIRGGLIGAHPQLGEIEGGGQKHHTDYRRIYAALLEHWLGLESRPILGQAFVPLEVLG